MSKNNQKSGDFADNKLQWPASKRDASMSSKCKMNNQLLAQTKTSNSRGKTLAFERWQILKKVILLLLLLTIVN